MSEKSDLVSRAGIRERIDPVQHNILRVVLERNIRLQRFQRTPFSGSVGESGDANSVDAADDDAVERAAADAIMKLRRGGKVAMETWMSSQRFDVLEQHTILRDALSRTQGQERQEIEEAIADLMDGHGDAVRSGVKAKNEFLSLAHDETGAVFELQNAFLGSGKKLVASEYLVLAKKMRAITGGGKKFPEALAEMRASVARASPRTPTDMGPKVWFSQTNAQCFHMIQSAFAIANTLRGNLSDAKLEPGKSSADATIALLSAGSKGEGSGESPKNIFDQIVGRSDLNPAQARTAYGHIHSAVALLPTKLWDHDKSRSDLLKRLKDLASKDADLDSRMLEREDAPMEKALRRRLAAR